MAKEKEEFVVADRRKFTAEGELRPDVPAEPLRDAARAEAARPGSSAAATEDHPPQMPPPPTAAEQDAQHRDYQSAGKKIDDILEGAGQ